MAMQRYQQPSRVLNDVEMAFFSWTCDEREASALARICTLPPNATFAEIEDTALKCFVYALEAAGLKDSVEYVNGQNFKYRRGEIQ